MGSQEALRGFRPRALFFFLASLVLTWYVLILRLLKSKYLIRMKIEQAIRNSIRTLIYQRYDSQRQFCLQNGIAPTFLNDWLASRRNISFDKFVHIVTALGLKIGIKDSVARGVYWFDSEEGTFFEDDPSEEE